VIRGDDDGLRELTRRLLERQGYTVRVSADADEAVRVFEQNAGIDVLLTDVVMPGVSGPELTGLLVERRPDSLGRKIREALDREPSTERP